MIKRQKTYKGQKFFLELVKETHPRPVKLNSKDLYIDIPIVDFFTFSAVCPWCYSTRFTIDDRRYCPTAPLFLEFPEVRKYGDIPCEIFKTYSMSCSECKLPLGLFVTLFTEEKEEKQYWFVADNRFLDELNKRTVDALFTEGELMTFGAMKKEFVEVIDKFIHREARRGCLRVNDYKYVLKFHEAEEKASFNQTIKTCPPHLAKKISAEAVKKGRASLLGLRFFLESIEGEIKHMFIHAEAIRNIIQANKKITPRFVV